MKRKYTSLPFTEYPVAEGNFDRSNKDKKYIVLHTTVGSLQGSLAWFNNPKAKVSANYIIDRDGKLYALLEEYYTSYANGNYDYNQQSITIEHVDNGNANDFRTKALLEKSAQLVADICKFYNIPCNRTRVLKHNEVPGSSTACPGNLPVDEIVKQAQNILNPTDDALQACLKAHREAVDSANKKDEEIKKLQTQLQKLQDSKGVDQKAYERMQKNVLEKNEEIRKLELQVEKERQKQKELIKLNDKTVRELQKDIETFKEEGFKLEEELSRVNKELLKAQQDLAKAQKGSKVPIPYKKLYEEAVTENDKLYNKLDTEYIKKAKKASFVWLQDVILQVDNLL